MAKANVRSSFVSKWKRQIAPVRATAVRPAASEIAPRASSFRRQAARSGAAPSSAIPLLLPRAAGDQELVVAADVVVGVVGVARQHEQERIGSIFVLNGPDHLRDLERELGALEEEFLAVAAVVHEASHPPREADDELAAEPVSVCAAHLLAGHVEDDEEAGGGEREASPQLARGEVAAEVLDDGRVVQDHAFHEDRR